MSTPATASNLSSQEQCGLAATQALRPVMIDGLKDSEFIGRIVYLLDEFWAKQFDKNFTRETLGLTDAVIRSYSPDRPIQMPRDWWYKRAKVIVYDGTIQTAMGTAQDTDLPFYLTRSRKVYISDHALRTRLNGVMTGDANWAYLIAHEVSHHVQEHIGLSKLLSGTKPFIRTHLTKRMELQADCLAGFWIGRNRSMFTNAEIVSIIEFTGKIGGREHGSGRQRMNWLLTGLGAQTINECDTFSLKAKQL